MSKSLKKLIDINGLREFKNKFVGVGSAYVQTTAVDQTIAGTKTFSKPIVGSVTGNAATATTAATATNATYTNWLRTSSHSDHLFHTEWDNAGYFWTYVTAGDGGYRPVRVERSNSSGYADTAGNGVDSSGGGWIRFRNGIQICWAKIPCEPFGPPTWTYGASFSSTPVVTVCAHGKNTNSIPLTRAADIGTTSCWIVMVRGSGGSYASGEAQCIAIGKWK